jgi:uncharacterized protein DUF3592
MKLVKKYWIAFVIVFLVISIINNTAGIFLVGSFIFYYAITAVAFILDMKKKGVECTGKYLSFKPGTGGHKNPNIEFTTMEGDLITGEPFVYASTDLSKFRSYKNLIGSEVPILYDAEEPKRFIVADETAFASIVFAGLLLFSLAAISHGLYVFGHYLKMF